MRFKDNGFSQKQLEQLSQLMDCKLNPIIKDIEEIKSRLNIIEKDINQIKLLPTIKNELKNLK